MKIALVKKMLVVCVAAVCFCGFAAAAPRLVEIVPANGEKDVDPSLETVRFVFDEDMTVGRHYSICGGGDAYPGGKGSPQWVDSRTLEWPVELKANHEYHFSINCPSSSKGFRNKQGQPADYTPLSFTTGEERESSEEEASPASIAALFQQAIYAERTEGDLEKAISLYQQVLDQAADVERVAARALLQMAGCYEKKGDETNAAECYKKIIDYCKSQKSALKTAQSKLKELAPNSEEVSMLKTIAPHIWDYIGAEFSSNYMEAASKGVHDNTHVYSVMPDGSLYRGGIILFKNDTGHEITPEQEIHIGNFSPNNLIVVNQGGQQLESRMEADPFRKGRNRLFAKPLHKIAVGEIRGFGWMYPKSSKPDKNSDGEMTVKMQNFYGSEVLELFTLALPNNISITSMSENFTKKKVFDELTVYSWQKQVPENTNNQVVVTVKESDGDSNTVENTFIPDTSYMQNNEFMKFSITQPNGVEIGKQLWLTRSNADNWKIESFSVFAGSEASIQKHTLVEADKKNLAPQKTVIGNSMSKYEITYKEGVVHSKVTNWQGDKEKDIKVDGQIYDNEQAFYIIRSMPLSVGYEQFFMIYPPESGVLTNCHIKVEGVDKVDLSGNPTDCFKTNLTCTVNGQKLLAHTLWITTDSKHWIAKYDAGTAVMELAEYGVREFPAGKEDVFEMLKNDSGKSVAGDIDIPSEIDINKVSTDEEKKAAENFRTSGWRLFLQGKPAEAEVEFRKALALHPQMENGWQGLGWAQKAQNKNLNAKDSFEKCLEINPKNSAALNGMGQIAKEEDDLEKAEMYWKKGVAADRNATGPMLGLAQMYEEQEEYRNSLKYYNMWLKFEPNNQMAKDGAERVTNKLKE